MVFSDDGRLFHRESDRLSFRSDDPCHCDADSFRPHVSNVFFLGAITPPLNFFF